MSSIQKLCQEYSIISADDAERIQDLASYLQLFADISQADVFIDCPCSDKSNALVVAEAHPTTAKSLYNKSLVGQFIQVNNEPAVLFSLLSGKPVMGSRGVSLEKVIMQNVVPIKNPLGDTIGVLIIEKDSSEQAEQEKNVEILIETTGHLSETLMQFAMSESQIPSLMHEGLILFDDRRAITYANARANELLKNIGYEHPAKGKLIDRYFLGKFAKENFEQHGGMIFEDIQFGSVSLQVKAVSLFRDQNVVGGVILLRDISDLKEKEKQLMIKSAVIKEIHHRVKNNLQTIASLLRLQMRRSGSPELKKVYRESINRINSIAVIHESLAQGGLEMIDFKEIIERISRTIVSSMARPEQNIHVSITGDAMQFPSERATTLALIINELIQNCIVHAFEEKATGHISIVFGKSNGRASIQVTDDGVGIGIFGKIAENGHLGLQIVETLVKEDLEGVLEFQDTGNGTEVTITFPMKGMSD
jgi:two-component sensor histidine kinase